MDDQNAANEDWDVLKSFFPPRWRDLGKSTGAMKGLRKNKDEEGLLRTLLMHVGCGFSLRETATRASQAGLADLSDVALLKRLRKSENWLHALCEELFKDRGLDGTERRLRLVDATEVSEPGKTGSRWRVHYCMDLPSLRCSYFQLTPGKGIGCGESFNHFDAMPGDHFLGDRGYCSARAVSLIAARGADITVRLVPANVRLYSSDEAPFDLYGALEALDKPGAIAEWPVILSDRTETCRTLGRLCVVRKSHTAAKLAHKKLRRRAQKNGHVVQEETLLFAKYVLVFSTVDPGESTAVDVLDLYRYRWQVELIFKRFKQIARLGHLPKHDPASARAWLYGKLFIALMTERLLAHAENFSPWGCSATNSGTEGP